MASKDLQQPQPQAVQAKKTAKDSEASPRRKLDDHAQMMTRNEDNVTQGGSSDTEDRMQSIRDGEAEGVLGKAGTPAGATYSPFRLLPPTPPQSLYPRTSSRRLLEPEAARNTVAVEDRLVSTDRYRGNGLMLHCVPASKRPTEGFRQPAQAVERYPRRMSTAAGGGHRMRYYGDTGGLGGDPRHRNGGEDDDVLEKVNSSRDKGVGDDSDRQEEGQRQENNRVAQIAEGLLWVQKHPVLAAVAWLAGKVLVPGSEGSEKGGEGAESTTGEVEGKREVSQTSPEEAFDNIGRGASCWRAQRGSHDELKERRSGSSRLWGKTSKGRLSWSDDFGGSLAEYYEDDRAPLPSDSSSIQDGSAHSDTYPSTTATVSVSSYSDASGYIGRSHGSSKDDAPLRFKQGANTQSNTSNVDLGRGMAGVCMTKSGPGSNVGGEKEPSVEKKDAANHVAGGCAAMVNSNTFYGNMNEAMRDQELEDGKVSSGVDDGAKSALGFSTGTKSGRPGHATDNLGFPRHMSVPPSTDEGFTDLVGVGESQSVAGGTWSPQWGWYVTMTPPQDMYATPQTPVADSKTTNNSTMVGVNTPSLLDGRPPRP